MYIPSGGRTWNSQAVEALNPHMFRAYKTLISIKVQSERRKDLE
jgi:hypothetical protein